MRDATNHFTEKSNLTNELSDFTVNKETLIKISENNKKASEIIDEKVPVYTLNGEI